MLANNEYFHNQLLEGLNTLNSFTNSKNVNHILIKNLSLSEFTVPLFNDEGAFLDGPLSSRYEYEKQVQSSLRRIKNPCLYVFELINPDATTVFNAYKAFIKNHAEKNLKSKRACSSINETFIKDENKPKILYVGKSEKPIDGRIVVHFGYYEKAVAGLQLIHWGKSINLKINIHVFELLNNNIQTSLDALEKVFFTQLKPIIGKK